VNRKWDKRTQKRENPPGAAAAAWAWFYQVELNNGKIKIYINILEQITVLI